MNRLQIQGTAWVNLMHRMLSQRSYLQKQSMVLNVRLGVSFQEEGGSSDWQGCEGVSMEL